MSRSIGKSASRFALGLLVVGLVPLWACTDDPADSPAAATVPTEVRSALQSAPAGAEVPAVLAATVPSERIVPGSAPDDGPAAAVVRVTKVAQVPALATSIASTPGADELLIGDRTGVVRRLRFVEADGYRVPELDQEIVLDLSPQVTTQFNRGFINMALVDEGRSLVVMYTGPQGELRLEQYDYLEGAPIDPSTRRVLAELEWDYPFHHGGGLATDAEGNLIVGLGDKGLPASELFSPDGANLAISGVTRIPAAVLADRSSTWDRSADGMLARGLRNPWRISVDADTGDVFIGDVGNLDYEEVDRIPGDLVGERQLHFGHPFFEGPKQLYEQVDDTIEFTPATLARAREEGACGMVAGHRYRSDTIAGLQGSFVYGDLCGMELRAFDLADDATSQNDRSIGGLTEGIVAIGRGPSGELYALGYQGGVYRVDPVWWTVPDSTQIAESAGAAGVPPPGPVDVPEYCGVIEQMFQAIEPLDAITGMSPATLRRELTAALASLQRLVPLLPADLAPFGATIEQSFVTLDRVLASSGYDPSSPEMDEVLGELERADGRFEGFPDAIVAFSDVGCDTGS